MRFVKAEMEIEYLKNLDVVLWQSVGDATVGDSSTIWNDGDFGLD